MKKTSKPKNDKIHKGQGGQLGSKLSGVERLALERSNYDLVYPPEEKIPSIIADNFPALGKLTAIRFLEWVLENPDGVISLPTGKTPEYFIRYVQHFLSSWETKKTRQELEDMGLQCDKRPDLSGLRFVQIDEFYPIDSKQHNSFYYYVNKYYIKGFGLDPDRALLINASEIGMTEGSEIDDIFPDMSVDVSLRFRKAKSLLQKRQQNVLIAVDQFCTDYERKIRAMGGIGFFLGGIGPDGHIAFNVRGSDFFSTTRLTQANYETKATAASDLGGIEVARNKSVITIGLATIGYNPEAVAIIFAAGEAKANIIAKTIQSPLSNYRPGSSLLTLPNARFYLTRGSAAQLKNRLIVDFSRKESLSEEDMCRVVMDLSLATSKPIRELNRLDFDHDQFAKELIKKSGSTIGELKRKTEETVLGSLTAGHTPIENKTFLHTAPHHDDIILGYLPYITNLVRRSSTHHYFAYMTSGFNAVTNKYMGEVVRDLMSRLDSGDFNDLIEQGYFDTGNDRSRRLDTTLYMQGVARHHLDKKDEATSRRLLRNLIEIYEEEDINNIGDRLRELDNYFTTQYPGKKDYAIVQQLKGRVREWESDLKWAVYGFTGEAVRHLRLGFYQGDIFTEQPTVERDVEPILQMLREINPDVVTVAFDPEGSGPDTHYKVLQAVSQALHTYEEESGRHDLKVLGYRNVWYRFHPSESNLYVPSSLTHLNDMESTFDICFNTQRTASFPNWEYDGPFSRVARKTQVKQFENIKTFLGEDFFVSNEDHGLRACCGIVFLREMGLEEFYTKSQELRKYAEDF
jgi:glucosamine-6-phosphate deaminase